MRMVKDFKKYFKYSIVSAKAQLETEVANSYLNWIWWILEPLCTMLIYAFIFGKVFGMKTENYPIFIFIGIMMYDFFSKSIKNSIKLIKRNKQIITKVYIPKFILLMSDLFVNGFKMMMCMIVIIVMMIYYKMSFIHIIGILPLFLALYLFTFSICIFTMHFGVYVEDLSNVINIILKFLFYFTGIFYSIQDKFPKEYSTLLLRFYPVAKLIDYARNVIMYNSWYNILYILTLFIISLVVSIIGIHFIYKNENSYVKLI